MGKKRNKKTPRSKGKPKARTPPPPPPETETQTRNWLDLPRDVTVSILSRLRAIDVLESAQKVCMGWRNICKDPLIWRTVDMSHGDCDFAAYDLDKMCRHAVDRSCGNLVDINIEHNCTDDLLKYITDRCGGIRRLRLVYCYFTSERRIYEVASRLALLEELNISLCRFSLESLQVLGSSCPLLRSFKLNRPCTSSNFVAGDNDGEALAIAGTMHGLRHLQLDQNQLTDDGLRQILDSCPHLESLDLRHCFNLNLEGDLGKRCTEQIKQLWLPDDSIDDYEFPATPYGFANFWEYIGSNDCEDPNCYDDLND
ncbi:unnamed protein product [Prunus brigantina]